MGIILTSGPEYKEDPLLKSLNDSGVFSKQFYLELFVVLFVFSLGFLAGNLAHDKCCHMKLERRLTDIELYSPTME